MAYASLVCLTNTLDENIQLNLIPQNSQYIQTLLREASFFQDFLEKSLQRSSEKVKSLEIRIRDVAYKAQDIIESHIKDRLLKESETRDLAKVCYYRSIWRILRSICRSTPQSNKSFTNLFQDLNEIMEEMNSIKQEVMQIEKNKKEEEGHNDEPDLQPRISSPARSSAPPSLGTTTMVGLDDDLMEIKTRLLRNSSELEIVSLVGMGGIGKTTLATKVYDDSYIVYHFDIRAWATVSEEYNVRNILLGLLGSKKMSEESNEELEEKLYKCLKGMRFLIVLDDLWDTRIWDYLRRLFPNDNKGSRILLTTRLEQVAKQANSCPPLHRMRLLNDDESWNLFCEKVFGSDCCPPLELEEIGREIVRNCRGLPLAVKVIGGHLSKATRTEHYWRSVENNLSETITSEDDEQCSKILSLSYKHLPHRLKGCFLYMSIFPEDYDIKVSVLVHLWIASGFIKQERFKCSEEDVAKEYFLDLVERNLILVSNRKFNGKIMKCKIHDLIRDLCVKEANNEKFSHIIDKTHYYHEDHVDIAQHSRHLRAFYRDEENEKFRAPMVDNQVDLRYFYHGTCFFRYWNAVSFHKLLRLHTICSFLCLVTLNIWEMPQLRHVKIKTSVTIPDPPSELEGNNSVIVLEKLQTLGTVKNLTFTDGVLRRIPNLKTLGVSYFEREGGVVTDWRDFDLNNLMHLHKLESLDCSFHGTPVVLTRDITFPPWIKKLTLECCHSPWEDMTIVGSLPNLEVLKLINDAFIGTEWKPNEGEFCNLKNLLLWNLNLVHWRAEVDHFPKLQHLFIKLCKRLQEIPRDIGDIPTLQLIQLYKCGESVESSARQIEEEQHDFGNEGFQVITGCYF